MQANSERLPDMVVKTLREQWARVAQLDAEVGPLRRNACCAVLAVSLACGGDSGPSPSEYPSVAGSYNGIIRVEGSAITVYPATRVTVRQSGSSITMTGLVEGVANFETSGTIDRRGVLTGSGGGIAEPYADTAFGFCGQATTTRLEVRFGTLSAEWDETAETAECGTRNYTGTLER